MLNEETIKEAIEGNMCRNAELLTVLHGKKVLLDASHKIEFHYWARNEDDVTKLKEALIQSGAIVKEVMAVKEEDETMWNATAEVNTTPALAASLMQTKANVMLAAKYDCVYDGWGMRLDCDL